MKRLIVSLGAVAMAMPLFLLVSPAAQASDSENAKIEQELIKLENHWADAVIKVDGDFLQSVMADDYLDTYDNGTMATKAQEIASLKSGDLKFASAADDDYKVRVYGNSAVVTYRSTVKGNYKGKDFSGQYQNTDTWVKRGRHWQCVAAHDSKITAES